MGLDVTGCCRLCLKDASSEQATHIDILQQQEVGELVRDLYGLNIKRSERGSKYICLPCYKEAINLKKHRDLYRDKQRFVLVNQTILKSQADAFPEEDEPELEVNEPWCDPNAGYCPPVSTPVDILLTIEDCMRSKLFRDSLQNYFDLGHLDVSGPIYQEDSDSFLDIWHPTQLLCGKCLLKFDDQTGFDAHHEKCRHKCKFCKRNYAFLESYINHACSKRDRVRNDKKRKYDEFMAESTFKRVKVFPSETLPVSDQPPEAQPAPAVEKDTLEILPLPDLLPAPAEVPHIDGEATLDAELSNLLERWYGQTEEHDGHTRSHLGTIEITNDNGTITNSEFYSRVIDTAYRNDTAKQKPSISVKPMSQLINTSVAQTTVVDDPPQSSTVTEAPPVEIIEIDDDDDVADGPSAASTSCVPQLTTSEQQALSESDILNIVKHFRGIDENESYLIKAKINGAQKLICISKRKNDPNSPSSSTPIIVNNNSALQSVARRSVNRPATITPVAKQNSSSNCAEAPTVSSPSLNPPLVVRNVAAINGQQSPAVTPKTPVPQLKIAHVQSLVQSQTAKSGPHQSKLSNGKQTPTVTQLMNHQSQPGAANMISIPGKAPLVASQVKSPPANQQPPAKADPRRIILGSSSIKLLNNSPKQLQPIAPKPPYGTVSAMNSVTTTTSTQQRIIVQRKQVQTVVQSAINRNTAGTAAIDSVSSANSMNDGGDFNSTNGQPNSLLRSQLLQLPTRVYPSTSGEPSTTPGRKIISVSPTGRHLQINNTTISRLN
ncbi:uncharacterized protein LOC129721524 [Wyeomyia smithii]|uniref:uncharacterized protein LOC129721524 n=1 Tax=Wyeomyia smithii TaxID=174621 RepID=UPI002467CD3B|nr:uncharacterized protein LOC129721524 [Wyeomyia smithii]